MPSFAALLPCCRVPHRQRGAGWEQERQECRVQGRATMVGERPFNGPAREAIGAGHVHGRVAGTMMPDPWASLYVSLSMGTPQRHPLHVHGHAAFS